MHGGHGRSEWCGVSRQARSRKLVVTVDRPGGFVFSRDVAAPVGYTRLISPAASRETGTVEETELPRLSCTHHCDPRGCATLRNQCERVLRHRGCGVILDVVRVNSDAVDTSLSRWAILSSMLPVGAVWTNIIGDRDIPPPDAHGNCWCSQFAPTTLRKREVRRRASAHCRDADTRADGTYDRIAKKYFDFDVYGQRNMARRTASSGRPGYRRRLESR